MRQEIQTPATVEEVFEAAYEAKCEVKFVSEDETEVGTVTTFYVDRDDYEELLQDSLPEAVSILGA